MADETYRTIIEQISRKRSSSITVFSDFCRIVACELAVGSRKEEYLEAIKPYSKDELNELSRAMALLIDEMQANPFTDLLGTYYTEIASHSSKQARGEFYTPPAVCEVMARMTVDPEEVIAKGRPITVGDPCCGSGGIILSLAKLFSPAGRNGEESYVDLLRVTCQDINPVAVDMCYINTSLWGIPATVILGNTLHATFEKGWRNIHWVRVGEDQRQAIQEVIRLISEPAQEPEEKNPASSSAMSEFPSSNQQFEFNLDFGNPEELSR